MLGDIWNFYGISLINLFTQVNRKLQISQRIFDKIVNGPNEMLIAQCMTKNLKSKISRQASFMWCRVGDGRALDV